MKGRPCERCPSRTLGERAPGCRPSPRALGAGAQVGQGAQVRGGALEGENRPARRTPGSWARRPERRARAGGRGRSEGTGGGGEGRGGSRSPRAAHSPGLEPPAAGAGFLPEARSFFLPFPLPLPSLRSDISPEECTLSAGGCGRRRRATSLVRGLGKSLSPEGSSDPSVSGASASSADAACGAVRCGPVHLGLAIAPAGGRPGSRGRSCRPASPRFSPHWVPPLPAPVLASARRAGSPTGKGFTVRRALPCPGGRRSAPALRASPESQQVLGNSSPALFQLPHSHPPPSRRLEAGASFAPSPSRAPSLFPTTPPPRGADTPPGGAWARRSRAQPLSLPEPGGASGRGAATRPAAAGNSRQGALEPARSGRRRRRRRSGKRRERRCRWKDPGKDQRPALLAPLSHAAPPEGLVRSLSCREMLETKVCNSDTCPPN